jgi:hypothetical protein
MLPRWRCSPLTRLGWRSCSLRTTSCWWLIRIECAAACPGAQSRVLARGPGAQGSSVQEISMKPQMPGKRSRRAAPKRRRKERGKMNFAKYRAALEAYVGHRT